MTKESDHFIRKTWMDTYLGMFDGTVAEGWFKWAEWLLVTAALYALARAGESRVVEVLAYSSGLLTCLYGVNRIEKVTLVFKPALHQLPLPLRIVASLVLLAGFSAITLAMTSAVNVALY